MSSSLEYILELLEPMGGITSRAMFGGHCLYKDGVIFAIVDKDTLYFKVDDSNVHDFKAKGSKPFTYQNNTGKTIAMCYWEVPVDVIEDSDTFIDWAKKSVLVGCNTKFQK